MIVEKVWGKIRIRPVRDYEARRRLRLRILVVFLILLIPVYIRQVLAWAGGGTGDDFVSFYAASLALREGHDPYDPAQLVLIQQRLWSSGDILRLHPNFVNPPFFAWALVPITYLSFRQAYGLWAFLSLAAAISGAILMLKSQGWRGVRWPIITLFAISPVTFLGLFWGQPSGWLLLSLAASLVLLRGEKTFWSGACLGLAWLKPHVLLPIAMTIGLLAWRRWWPFILGFGAATGGLAILSLVTGPSYLGSWLGSLYRFGSHIDLLADISSLPGLYITWMPRPLSMVVTALLLMGAMAFAIAVLRYRSELWTPIFWRKLSVLITLWLLVAPYAHPADDILLLLPVLFLVRNDYSGLKRPSVEAGLIALSAIPILYPTVLRYFTLVGFTSLAVAIIFIALKPWQLLRRIRENPGS